MSEPRTNPSRTPGEVLLDIQHLNKSFGGLKVTNDVSLQLRAGIVTTLVGPNGAGKTTLFNQITGHLKPESGEVRWLGQSILGQSPWQIARLGIATFQDLRLFDHMSVEDNVTTVMEPTAWLWQRGGKAAKAERQARTADILAQTGLSARAKVRAIDLSYAERKFLSMARVLASDARIWLLDEPYNGLDQANVARLDDQLHRHTIQGGIAVIASHIAPTVNVARSISMDRVKA